MIDNKKVDDVSLKEDVNDVNDASVTSNKNLRKRKIKNLVRSGIIVVKATFNNTRVTVTDVDGNVLCWNTAGRMKFKGSSKSTSYVAQVVANDVGKKANQNFGMSEASVLINGPGPGRESAVRGIVASGIRVILIKDVTPIPHNGCRAPKKRRI